MVTLRKKNEFATDSLIQDLNSLLKFEKGQQESVQVMPEINLKVAMAATAAIIQYLDVSLHLKIILIVISSSAFV